MHREHRGELSSLITDVGTVKKKRKRNFIYDHLDFILFFLKRGDRRTILDRIFVPEIKTILNYIK